MAVSGSSSPGSRLPLARDQSCRRGRWMSRTSGPSGPRRHGTTPAASISPTTDSACEPGSPRSSGIGRPRAPDLDQLDLDVPQPLAVRSQVVPGPGAVTVQPPGRGAVVHAQVQQLAQLPAVALVADPDHGLHPPVQVPGHHVGAPQPYLVVGLRAALVLAGGQRGDP